MSKDEKPNPTEPSQFEPSQFEPSEPEETSAAEPGPVSEQERRVGERLAERLTQQLSQQWSQMRAERRSDPPPVVISGGTSNFSRAQVPWGLDLAAAWSWRLLIIGLGVYVVAVLLGRFAVITMPLAIALLLAALLSPFVRFLAKAGVPRSSGSILGVTLTLSAVGLLLTFAGQQVASGATDLADSVAQGLAEIRVWLREGPLHASDSQVNDYIGAMEKAITEWSKSDALGQVTDIGAVLGQVTAGFFIALFAMYFFLADGARIWSWVVRLTPRAAREVIDSSGRVAWISLTQYVRATVIVAFVDAVGIAIVAAVLDVPFVLAIGVLVFLGAFVPLIGATLAGGVAVLVALVDQGPFTALLMLAGVIVVQQIEGNVLQPFLMGRFVSIHPLGVIIAIAAGLIVAGIGGALLAVPLVASVNGVVLHLAGRSSPADLAVTDAEEVLLEPDAPSEMS